MKKLLTIVLASALVLTFVAPAMAMHFEMNGQLRVRNRKKVLRVSTFREGVRISGRGSTPQEAFKLW